MLYLRWVFDRFPDTVTLPFEVKRGVEFPDFIMTEGGETCGLEETRASTWAFQRGVDALVDANGEHVIECGPELNIEFDQKRKGDDQFDPSSLIIPVGGRLESEGWFGLEPEIQWAEIVAFRITEKRRKLIENYLKVVPKCDLILYSDVHAPIIELEEAARFLRERVDSSIRTGETEQHFRRVSFICENWMIFDVFGEEFKIVKKEVWLEGLEDR
jgi:hypothetical protein